MVLMNYIKLQAGATTRLHFIDHRLYVHTVTDTRTGNPKLLQALEFVVDALNGQPIMVGGVRVYPTYGVTSQNQANQFAGYLPDKRYTSYDFLITPRGEGDLRKYTVEPIPLG